MALNKKYKLVATKKFAKDLEKLDYKQRIILLKKFNDDITNADNPRQYGKPLIGNLKGFWRYRYGSYRIIVKIEDNELIILALEIKHRKDIYKNK